METDGNKSEPGSRTPAPTKRGPRLVTVKTRINEADDVVIGESP